MLAADVVCNLPAKLMFLIKGVKPHTWLEKRKARQSVTVYTALWVVTPGSLLAVVLLRQQLLD